MKWIYFLDWFTSSKETEKGDQFWIQLRLRNICSDTKKLPGQKLEVSLEIPLHFRIIKKICLASHHLVRKWFGSHIITLTVQLQFAKLEREVFMWWSAAMTSCAFGL